MKKICLLIFFIHTFNVFADDWKRVYLATYPRSGNHWMRYLLEEATHIATSSVYFDADELNPHLLEPFEWGGYCADHGYEGNCKYADINDIIVIKTHYPALPEHPFDNKPYIKSIRIVRHPVDSFYSFFRYYNTPYKSIPKEFVVDFIHTWKLFQNYWNSQDNVLTIRYEDLIVDPEANFILVLNAIGYTLPNEDIIRAIKKYPPIGYELKHVNKFSQDLLDLINDELKELMDQFNYKIEKNI